MSIALYELSEAHRNILNMIDEETPDQDIIKALLVIEGQIETKALNIANITTLEMNDRYAQTQPNPQSKHNLPQICILARLAAALGVSIKELVEER